MQVLKLSKAHFVEDSVFLDLVLDFVMHVNSASPYSTRSGSFCWGLELFCSSVEASFFGLVVMPRIVEGCFFAAVVSKVGLFLCSSSGVGLFCSTRSGVGLFCSRFSVGTPTILCQAIRRSCQSYTLHILASRREEMELCRVVFVIFLCSLYCVTKTVLRCYALGI